MTLRAVFCRSKGAGTSLLARAREGSGGWWRFVVDADVSCSFEVLVPIAALLELDCVDDRAACDFAERSDRSGFSGDSGKRTEAGSEGIGGGGG